LGWFSEGLLLARDPPRQSRTLERLTNSRPPAGRVRPLRTPRGPHQEVERWPRRTLAQGADEVSACLLTVRELVAEVPAPRCDHRKNVSPADYASALQRLHAGMRKLTVTSPHFTDRVAEAQQLVASRDLTPSPSDADRELLADVLGSSVRPRRQLSGQALRLATWQQLRRAQLLMPAYRLSFPTNVGFWQRLAVTSTVVGKFGLAAGVIT
jgi:hypothetical protein